ncbi:MAG: PhnD/SsuA/transferrin family substrate-binding protein, partial [Halobacteria archaeon]|nr:PhnD/SsuA/transferrin family substrate-binding protein [Halobacteria archaeon]
MKDDDNNANWSIGRRKFLAGTGVAAAGGLAGCMGGSGGSTSSGTQQASKGGSSSTQTETVTFVLTPSNPTEVRKNYLPMKKYLEANIDGLDVKFRVPTDYSAIRPALTSGQAEIAMDDITLMGIPNKVDVLGTTVTGGTAFYFSIITTKPDSGLETLQDL